MGPEGVAIISEKLRKSLSEGDSLGGAVDLILMDMPRPDRVRAEQQYGLIFLQGTALKNISLQDEEREAALTALYEALKSPYRLVRGNAARVLGNVGNDQSADKVFPLLKDPDVFNRVAAADALAKIGNASSAAKIEEVLKERRSGLTEAEIERDGVFHHGYEAIKRLNSKWGGLEEGSQADSPMEIRLSEFIFADEFKADEMAQLRALPVEAVGALTDMLGREGLREQEEDRIFRCLAMKLAQHEGELAEAQRHAAIEVLLEKIPADSGVERTLRISELREIKAPQVVEFIKAQPPGK